MKTILITGHDTGIGKTWVTRFIARKLSGAKAYVQVIKPVETGVSENACGDVATILNGIEDSHSEFVSGFTLNSFKVPLAPLSAAALEGGSLSINKIVEQIQNLPETDWRLIETAGGLAVPLDASGADGRDLAIELQIDYIVLIIHNRLGAINQARLLRSYIPKEFQEIGFWLNDVSPRDPLVTASNLAALQSMSTPLWAHQGHYECAPEFCNSPFINQSGLV